MARPFDNYLCRRRSIELDSPERLNIPPGLYRIAKVEIHGRPEQGCCHTLDIRDRFRDGGSTNKYWFQQDPVLHRCTAKHLLPIIASVLEGNYPHNRIANLEGTITMTREHAPIEDVAALLVRELSSYLAPKRVVIYYYARSDYRGRLFDHDGKPWGLPDTNDDMFALPADDEETFDLDAETP